MKKNLENGFNPFSFVFLRTVPKKTLISLYKTKKLVNTIAKGEQVNTKSNDGSDEIPITIGRKILETENIIKFIPDDKEIKVV